jgi:DNA/RNA-binding domain of Phe-tRNA-synthetase-like protein
MIEISVQFSDHIRKKIGGIKLGLLYAQKMTVEKNPMKIKPAFDQLQDDIKAKFRSSPPSAHPVVSAVRRMYRRIGWEPTQYRPSSEAMIRRLIKNKGLYHINNLVDLGNICSARYHIPMGLYDYDKIIEPIQLDVGKDGEVYEGISKEIIHAAGKLILRDRQGIFGNPTADSRRTSILAETTNVLAIFFTPPEIDHTLLKEMLEYLEKLYKESCPRAYISLSSAATPVSG